MPDQKITDPNWGKAELVINDPSWGSKPEPAKQSNTLKMRKNVFADDYDPIGLFPRDPKTGERLDTPVPKVPRGTLPVLAGMAAAAGTGGLSVPLQAAIAGLAGAAGEGGEEALRGEPIDPARMAGEGLGQAVMPYTSKAAGPIGRGIAKVGDRLAAFKAGLGTKALLGGAAWGAASALPSGLREGAAAVAMKAMKPAAEGVVKATGRGVATVGNAIEGAAAKSAVDRVAMPPRFLPGPTVTSHKTPMIPDALRKMQLLYRIITNQDKQ